MRFVHKYVTCPRYRYIHAHYPNTYHVPVLFFHTVLTQAQQDYTAERTSIVEAEKLKLTDKYKQLQNEKRTQRRMYVKGRRRLNWPALYLLPYIADVLPALAATPYPDPLSELANKLMEQRRDMLHARDESLQSVLGAAKDQLASLSSDVGKYKTLLHSLLVQSVDMLTRGQGGTHQLVITCREQDARMIQDMLPAVQEAVASTRAESTGKLADAVAARRTEAGGILAQSAAAAAAAARGTALSVTLSIDTTSYLPAGSAGGVQVAANDGRVVCDNTLERRLDVAAHSLAPQLRSTLFPAMASEE